MTVLYVASHQSRAGKTALAVTLASILRDKGTSVAVFKPVTSVAYPGRDPDPAVYSSLLDQTMTVSPVPIPAEGVTDQLLDDVRRAAVSFADVDVVVAEAPSSVSVADSARLAESLGASVVGVVGYAAAADSAAHWAAFGDRFIGAVVNGLPRYRGNDARTATVPALEDAGTAVLGVVPEDRTLLGITVGQIAETLGGRFVSGGELADGLVEHLLVGGLGLDSGALYFRLHDRKAVVVRGDRPDIQMAALQTPTTCMVLTRGVEPIEYVLNEAELEEVPVIVVETDTLGTMDALVSTTERAAFDHPSKLSRSKELLAEHVDLDRVLSPVG